MNSRLTTGLLLISLVVALPLAAQQTASDSDNPAELRHCTTVALTSEAPELPYRLVAPYLQRRPDFQASKLVLSDEPADADAHVQLGKGDPGYTRIQVTNRLTGQHKSIISGWTDYPGMVAMDTMEQLKVVCAGLNVASSQPSAATACNASGLVRAGRSLAACSHTSWMDNREIYEALQSRDELTQRSIQLLPACRTAGTVLDITHNLDRTAEWNWKLQSAQGHPISEGTVIASSSRDAAAKIAENVVRDVPYEPANQPQVVTAGECVAQAQDDGLPNKGHGRGFKYVMRRAAFYAGEGIAATAIVSGYAAWYAAMGMGAAMAMGPD